MESLYLFLSQSFNVHSIPAGKMGNTFHNTGLTFNILTIIIGFINWAMQQGVTNRANLWKLIFFAFRISFLHYNLDNLRNDISCFMYDNIIWDPNISFNDEIFIMQSSITNWCLSYCYGSQFGIWSDFSSSAHSAENILNSCCNLSSRKLICYCPFRIFDSKT